MKIMQDGRKDAFFIVCCLIILTVSAIDSYLNLKYPVTTDLEENPVARLVLYISNQDHYLLMSIKVFTTGLVIMIISFLYKWRKDMGMVVALPVATAQVLFMVYMLT